MSYGVLDIIILLLHLLHLLLTAGLCFSLHVNMSRCGRLCPLSLLLQTWVSDQSWILCQLFSLLLFNMHFFILFGYRVPGYPMMVGYPMVPPHMSVPMMMPGTGSIRSVQSVPMLSPPAHTWDGEPCPVHHHHPMVPLAALYGLKIKT